MCSKNMILTYNENVGGAGSEIRVADIAGRPCTVLARVNIIFYSARR